MKVLIVDDSRAMRMIVRRTLRQAGFKNLEISEAVDGRDALNKVMVSPPDLILSDWNMPVMDGMTFLNELRTQFKTPFCFVTAQGSAEMRERARIAGANFLISKPFTPDTFSEVLNRFIS